MIIIDACAIREPTNADEALAYTMRLVEPGDVVWFHGDWCRTQLHVCEPCTCTPRTMRIGAKG